MVRTTHRCLARSPFASVAIRGSGGATDTAPVFAAVVSIFLRFLSALCPPPLSLFRSRCRRVAGQELLRAWLQLGLLPGLEESPFRALRDAASASLLFTRFGPWGENGPLSFGPAGRPQKHGLHACACCALAALILFCSRSASVCIGSWPHWPTSTTFRSARAAAVSSPPCPLNVPPAPFPGPGCVAGQHARFLGRVWARRNVPGPPS